MRKVLLTLAASLAVATPALANEARVEVRGGVIWGNGVPSTSGNTEATIGAAAGYDFDLGSSAFAGVEVSGDKILDHVANRVAWGFTGRLGFRASPGDKVFAAGGYTTKPCSVCADSEHLGAGWEHSFGRRLYGKVEYRHFFTNQGVPDADSVVGGVGVHF